jgi:predicted AlkP superfamily pyrophosphatase or phosphodiesterase
MTSTKTLLHRPGRLCYPVWLALAWNWWAGCAPALAQPVADRNRHVVVISLDGFPASVLRDQKLPFPVLRKLIREGAVAEGMTPVNPTVTWPNHTAMVTGVNAARHGVIYNGLPVRGGEGKPMRVEPWIDKTELVQAPTVYDAAYAAGLTTAEVDWVAIYRPPTVTWPFPEQPKPDGTVEREMLDAGAISAEELASWSKTNNTLHDEIWTRAAAYIIEKHRPNLLLMHLLLTDSVQHQYGAGSLAAHTALILADRQVQRVLDAIDRAGIRETTTVFVVSDHGFKAYQRIIRPNALLRAKGLLRDQIAGIDCDAFAIPEGGTAMVYVTRQDRREATLKTLSAAFQGVPGIAKVILPAEYETYGYPAVERGRMSDMVLVAEPGYGFDGNTNGETVVDVPSRVAGAHGYLNSDADMNAILVAWGAGIQPGAQLGLVPNVNVAPTIAHLLNVNLPGVDGVLLRDMLRK